MLERFNKIAAGIFIAVSIIAIGIIVVATKKPAGEKFTGTGNGRNGKIEISITVNNGKIVDAVVLSHEETPSISDPALTGIIEQVKKAGTPEGLDAVSGATLTSNGMIDAIKSAYALSRGEQEQVAKAQDAECDIVIIGAGGAGLVAATEAASNGASVIILEKMGIVGGNTNSAEGGINASYTKEQKKLGIIDSPDIFYADTMKGGKNLNDPELLRTMVDNSAAIVDWLESDIVGADLSDVGMAGGATNKRIHRPQGGSPIGAHLVPLLYKAAQKQGAAVRLNSKVTDIISDNGRAVGVNVSSDAGDYKVLAKAVIIATGGFGANPDMLVKYNPKLEGFKTTNHKGATGDAFAWIEKFDGALTQMEQIQTHPTTVPGSGVLITEGVRGNGAILVSRTGKRFIDEMKTRDVVSEAILGEPGKTAFLIFDSAMRKSLKAIENYAKQGLLTEATSIEELAKKIGVDAPILEKTMAAYAGYVHNEKDAEFGRNPQSMEQDLTTAPFYAIEVCPAVHHTMGGIKINTKAQVLNKADDIIPALYAAGEVTGGVHGGNRLGGNAVSDICIFGKIAADTALADIASK